MPAQQGEIRRMEKDSVSVRRSFRDRQQEHWYELASKFVSGLSVVDVGAGTGYGLEILKAHGAALVDGIDPLPVGPDVRLGRVEDLSSDSFDVVIASDVIEHVDDDRGFLAGLLRVARKGVFLSTPNWNYSHCLNVYHLREYTPEEMEDLLRGSTYEPWGVDDRPPLKLPWRVPRFMDAPTGFGVWIWKQKRLRHRDEPAFDIWETNPSDFLASDRENPARAAAAAIIRKLGVRTMTEVGPGPGYDYADHFAAIGLKYVAYEPSVRLRTAFNLLAPGVDARPGSFLDLPPASCDLVYTKATLEHQRDFRDGLLRMIQAARHVLINWFLPPAATEVIQITKAGYWINTYRKDDVMAFLSSHGCTAEVHAQPSPPGNELWLIRKGKP